jgi:hypothetical protein
MSDEGSWGEDTVALNQGAHPTASEVEQRQDRVTSSRLPRPTRRAVAFGGVAVAVLALSAWIVGNGGGSGASEAPIREAADPARRVVVKPPPRMHRREPRAASKLRVHRRAGDRLEAKREPKASAARHGLDAPESTPQPTVDPPPEPIPMPALGPEAPPPTPAPTSSAAEFGM